MWLNGDCGISSRNRCQRSSEEMDGMGPNGSYWVNFSNLRSFISFEKTVNAGVHCYA